MFKLACTFGGLINCNRKYPPQLLSFHYLQHNIINWKLIATKCVVPYVIMMLVTGTNLISNSVRSCFLILVMRFYYSCIYMNELCTLVVMLNTIIETEKETVY